MKKDSKNSNIQSLPKGGSQQRELERDEIAGPAINNEWKKKDKKDIEDTEQ